MTRFVLHENATIYEKADLQLLYRGPPIHAKSVCITIHVVIIQIDQFQDQFSRISNTMSNDLFRCLV